MYWFLTSIFDISSIIVSDIFHHVIYIFICEFLAEVGHDMSEVIDTDHSTATFIKHSERFLHVFLIVSYSGHLTHHHHKCTEVNACLSYTNIYNSTELKLDGSYSLCFFALLILKFIYIYVYFYVFIYYYYYHALGALDISFY